MLSSDESVQVPPQCGPGNSLMHFAWFLRGGAMVKTARGKEWLQKRRTWFSDMGLAPQPSRPTFPAGSRPSTPPAHRLVHTANHEWEGRRRPGFAQERWERAASRVDSCQRQRRPCIKRTDGCNSIGSAKRPAINISEEKERRQGANSSQ